MQMGQRRDHNYKDEDREEMSERYNKQDSDYEPETKYQYDC